MTAVPAKAAPPSPFWCVLCSSALAFRASSVRGWLVLSAFVVLSASSGCGKSTSQTPRMLSAGDTGVAGDPPSEGGDPNSASSGAPQGGSSVPQGGSGVPQGGAPAAAGETSAGQAGALVEPTPLPPGLSLRAITISQTHELPLMAAGVEVVPDERPAPLIASKHALVRAFVDVEAGFVERPLLGVLDLKTPKVTRTLVSERTLTQSSLQDDLTTTFVFNVDAADLGLASTYRVRVLEVDTTPLAQYPADGYHQLGARALPAFELVVVPFISNGFAPLLGAAELTGLRQRLLALFPSTDVRITVATPVTLPYVVNGDGDGWDDALDLIYQLRADAAPSHDVFYYGAMAPDTSFGSYCNSDCILGFSNLAEESDIDSRGSIGITVFQDGSGAKDAWDTVAHELGHAMGREHAPCGIPDLSDTDRDYPYTNGTLGGIYGYDFDLGRLVKPRPAKDVMSYCSPVWISDYTYRAIYERLDYIASESFRALAFAPPPLFRLARIRRTGQSAWLGERRRRGSARSATVDLLDQAGQRVGGIEAQVVAVDHAPGGYVWLPAQELGQSAKNGAASVDLRSFGGSVLPL